jgi:hypothetical protein
MFDESLHAGYLESYFPVPRPRHILMCVRCIYRYVGDLYRC